MIVARRPDPDSARQVIYTLTEKGKDLIPALLELARWGAKHVARSVPPKNLARRIKEDPRRADRRTQSVVEVIGGGDLQKTCRNISVH